MFQRAAVFFAIVTLALHQPSPASSAAATPVSTTNAADSPSADLRSSSHANNDAETTQTFQQLSDLIKKVARTSNGSRYADAITRHTASLARYGILMLTQPSKLAQVEEIIKDLEGREWRSEAELNRQLWPMFVRLNEIGGLKPFDIAAPDFKRRLFASDESEGKRYTAEFLYHWAAIFRYRTLEVIGGDREKMTLAERLFKEPGYRWSGVREFLAYRQTVKGQLKL